MTDTAPQAVLVPEDWPLPREDLVAARPIRWWQFPFAVLGVLLVPRRLGPALGVSSIFYAVIVAGAALIVALSLGFGAVNQNRSYRVGGNAFFVDLDEPEHTPTLTLSERVRLPIVEFIEEIFDDTASAPWAAAAFGIFVLGIPVACYGLAWLYTPYVRVRERWWRGHWRAFKLLLWSTIALPIGASLMFLANMYLGNERGSEPWVAAAGAAGVLFWLHILRRLAMRAPLPPNADEGYRAPAHCLACDYNLTAQPVTARCPECGTPVADSLPAARQPTRWMQTRNVLQRSLAYLPTTWRVLRDRQYFRHIPAHTGRPAALRFACWSAWLGGFCVMLNVLVAAGLETNWDFDGDYWGSGGALLTVWLAATGMLWLLVAVVIFLASKAGFGDTRRATIVGAYGSAALVPVLVLSTAAIWTLYVTFESNWFDQAMSGSMPTADRIWAAGLVGLSWLPAVLALLSGMRGLLRVRRGMRDTRRATA